MIFREEKEVSKKYKQNYLDGINGLISSRQKKAAEIRTNYVKNIFIDSEKYRTERYSCGGKDRHFRRMVHGTD